MINHRGGSRSLNFSWVIPGELAGHAGPASREDLDFLRRQGIGALVRLTEGWDWLAQDIRELGFHEWREPVPDFSAPTQEQIDRAVRFIHEMLAQGKAVGVFCGAGRGRTGTILACYLVHSQGLGAGEAIKYIRGLRPGSIDVPEQEEAVRLFGERNGREGSASL